MSAIIYSIIDKFKGLWIDQRQDTKTEVEGYLMLNDSTSNKSLLLVKEGEKSWKTKWFNNNEHTYKAPAIQVNAIFNNQV
jgi:hypothetical protein